MNFVGQTFGNRKVLRNRCYDEDWTNLELKVPQRKDKYKLTKCLNCGKIIPIQTRYLMRNPPKRCVFCSNIGNHSKIKTETNSWVVYDDYAVCNVMYKNDVVGFYIDACDYVNASKYTWRISKKRQKYYVISGSAKKGTMQYLHRFIYGDADRDLEIDHIDGNSLNNRRNNLRAVDRQTNIDNQRATRIDNQIGIRGVSFDKKAKVFHVDFSYHGTRYYMHSWKTIEEAVWCRKCLEEYFGIEAIKNNPLAEQYYGLEEEKANEIQQYVLDQILRNKR